MSDRAEQHYILEKQKNGRTLAEAKQMWDNLDTVFKMSLINIAMQEEQNLEDLRLGLLATLSEYRGLPHVKKLFENSLKNVRLE